MAKSSIILICIYVVAACFGAHVDRKIQRTVNNIPCGNNRTLHIVHVKATNVNLKDDVIHYIWTAIGRPTIIVKHVMTPSQVHFNEKEICAGKGIGVTFLSNDTGYSGLIITEVIPYIDPKDEISLDGDHVHIRPDIATSFSWTYNDTESQKTSDSAVFKGTSAVLNGSINFMTKAYGTFGHTKELPHNPVTANLTEFTLVLDGLLHKDEHQRYAVGVLFFSSIKSDENAMFHTDEFLDDETTPGIFHIWAADFLPSAKRSYSTWKPVAYHDQKKSRETQTFAVNLNAIKGGKMHGKGTLPLYTGSKPWSIVSDNNQLEFYDMKVTFGMVKDGCYHSHPYISWTGLVGSGKPPSETLSKTALIVIICGVGAPFVVILIAVLYLVVRKIKLYSAKIP